MDATHHEEDHPPGRGAEAIAAELGVSTRRAFYLLERVDPARRSVGVGRPSAASSTRSSCKWQPLSRSKPEGKYMRKTRLVDIPTDEFPFNFERYSRVSAEVGEAASHFAVLGCAGNPHAAGLAKSAGKLCHAILLFWDEVVEAERLEKETAAR